MTAPDPSADVRDTADEWTELRALAAAAHYEGQRWYAEEEFVGRWPECCDCGCPVMMGANTKAEASFIAAANPATITRLLDTLDAVRALADEHERLVTPAAYTTERALIERLRAALDGGAR